MSRGPVSLTPDTSPAAASPGKRGGPSGGSARASEPPRAAAPTDETRGARATPPHPVAARGPAAEPKPLRGPFAVAVASGERPGSLVTWYLGLIPHWMGARPRLRTRLLLRTHQWIVERVLAAEVDLAAATADLRPDGELTRMLTELLPAEEAERWRPFIGILVADLRHALLVPVTRRNEAWVRWLFLIPYGAAAGGAVVKGRPTRIDRPFVGSRCAGSLRT